MTPNTIAFDNWIRSEFRDMNTELEELYFAAEDSSDIEGVGDKIKLQIRDDGELLIKDLVAEGNTDEGFDTAFDLLGNLGIYLASMRRHELTNPADEQRSPFATASALGLHLGASLGVAPRFSTAHISTHGKAVNGVYKSFTSLDAERVFLDNNILGVLAFKRAADALGRIVPLGISHPVVPILLEDAKAALRDVIKYNEILFDELDMARFFFNVRPYYKPYRVGRNEYRGANAGDFAGINVIDLSLGVCQGNDQYYSQLLADKMTFMMPEDQAQLRDCLRHQSLMDQLVELASTHSREPWFQKNCKVFLEVVDLFGETASQHHDQLVSRFIEKPAETLDTSKLRGITASGPPLPVLLNALKTLRDLRTAAERDDIRSRYKDVALLRKAIG